MKKLDTKKIDIQTRGIRIRTISQYQLGRQEREKEIIDLIEKRQLEIHNHIFEICIDCGSWEELEDLKKLIKEKKD